ncbi:hypothetical protein PAJ34TS1_35480 [Paenibacillus azoreducens]|uniref:Transposase IS4-like domain-containing protein n=1 Tax=Paenibacillus azoreducens TaxID=116718 RepID=A0A919YH90_9BACL|nr:hypothetical protein J34TS1_52240 [Paenibacillus azoreducens]
MDHRTVDPKYNMITDVHVNPGNVHDSTPYLSCLDRQQERFGFKVEVVVLDSGYSGYLTSPICKGLQKRKDRDPPGSPRKTGGDTLFS